MQTYGLRTQVTIGIVVLAAVVMTGCQGLSTPGGSGPSLSFAQTNVTFGSVPVGKTKTFTETITNSSPAASVMRAGIVALDSKGGVGAPTTGNNDITGITGISSSSSSYAVQGITLPMTLAPGQTATFKVVFTPKSKGMQAGTLSVSTNLTTPMSVALTGTGADPEHHCGQPEHLKFRQCSNWNDQHSSGNTFEFWRVAPYDLRDRCLGNRVLAERSKRSNYPRSRTDGYVQRPICSDQQRKSDRFVYGDLGRLEPFSENFRDRNGRCRWWTVYFARECQFWQRAGGALSDSRRKL